MRVAITFTFLLLIGSAELTNAQTVSVWLTTHDQSKTLEQQASVTFASGSGGSNPVVVDETQTYQQIEGFGASFTDSAAYLLNQVATPTARSNAMNNLFTRNGGGIGVSFVRNPMAASDLARTHYSYDDLAAGKTDVNLTNFSIAHDQADIIPLVQQALQLNPQLTIMANPWSPPGWMKDSGSMIGGSLLPSMYGPFARYFVKYIQAYQAAGIPTHYISLQNEPLYVPGDYPGMSMDAATQITVLRDYVLPTLAASNITTKVLVYDHNWDQSGYPQTVFGDATLLASSQVAGTAWHGYGGTPGVMLTLANQFPTKGNYQTEHSGGTWVGDQLRQDFAEIIHVMRCWGKAYVKWSLAQDQNYNPNLGGCNTCIGLVTVNSSSGAVTYNTDFYTLGHFSKFVLPGAARVYSANANGVVSAAFKNPDGSKALVASMTPRAAKPSRSSGAASRSAIRSPRMPASPSPGRARRPAVIRSTPRTRFRARVSIPPPASRPNGRPTPSAVTTSAIAITATTPCIRMWTSPRASPMSPRASRPSPGGPWSSASTVRPASRIAPSPCRIPATGRPLPNVSGSVSGATGVHDLYLVFKGGGSVANLNSFQFGSTLPPALPSPWVTADIGAVGATGSATYNGGTFEVSGSGADIEVAADEFRYVYQTSSGDCSIVARVATQDNTDPWAKAGVMIRESTAAGSMNAAVLITPGNGVRFQWRTASGGTTASTGVSGVVAPCWLKLQPAPRTVLPLTIPPMASTGPRLEPARRSPWPPARRSAWR